MTKQVHIRYYASLRERRGITEEAHSTTATTAEELYDELSSKYGFELPKTVLKVGMNDEIVPFSQSLHEGDRIAFIPPVAGG